MGQCSGHWATLARTRVNFMPEYSLLAPTGMTSWMTRTKAAPRNGINSLTAVSLPCLLSHHRLNVMSQKLGPEAEPVPLGRLTSQALVRAFA